MDTRIAAIQMRAEPGARAANLRKAKRFVEHAAGDGAKLVLLPELFNVGYHIGPELFEWWEPDDGPAVTWLREEAVARGIITAGSIAERRGDRLHNTLFVAEPGGRLHRYAKRQPTKNEAAAFDPGDDANIIDTSLGRMGVAVCANMTWGASLLRPLAGNIDLLIVPQASNAPRWQGRAVWWIEKKWSRPLFAGHVRCLGAPAALAGLIGPMQRVTRLVGRYLYGGTWIMSAGGRPLANVPFDHEGIAIADVRLGAAAQRAPASLLRDPGFGRGLLDALVIERPNLRPAARRTDCPAVREGGDIARD